MLKRIVISGFLFCFVYSLQAQVSLDSLSEKDKAALDSMLSNDAFLSLLNGKDKNYVDISVGIGNGTFSESNQAVNATGISNQLVLTPGISYHFKQGISVGVTGFFTKEQTAGSMQLYQTGLTAAYDYMGKKISGGVSYTRYISDAKKYNSKSLYQNDLYGYFKRSSGAIQPGIAVGYANGNYKDASFTSFILKRPLRGDTLISGIDSTENQSSYFSVSANIEHDFSLYNIFDKNDELDIVPSLIVNYGSDKYTQTHTNKMYDRLRALNKVKKVVADSKFQLQSVAMSLDLTYSIGKFFLQPNVYMDYYLPATTGKRLSTIYSVTTGFSF